MINAALTKEEIIHLGKLAKMSLSDEEIKRFQKQLTQTLDYIKNLQELNTENVEATNHTVASKNVFFEDKEENKRLLSVDEALSNSKNKKNNYFVVKRLI